jgi:EAL domain-containing protein (putative c-di-GMP-specific phosphodiesterase class I)
MVAGAAQGAGRQPAGTALPAAELTSGRVIGAEALLYWRHPLRGLLEAAQFLPHVMDRTLLDRVDAWVITQSCAQASLWQSLSATPPGRPLCIWINLAAPLLHADLLQMLLPAMRKHGLPACSIGIELNEKLLLGPSEPLAQLLTQMQSGGVRLALDDFGSARSSLAACKRWQLNALKIDRSFVHGIGNDEGGTDIVAAVVHLARALSMRVIALGVETRLQLEVLQELGCQACQGDLFYPPLPAAGLLEQTSDINSPSLLSNEE